MLVSLIYFVITLFYFHPMLSSRVVFTERDLSPFFIPPKYLWVQLAKSFHLPVWNPYNYSGIPLLATIQPGIFYPPHIFYLFLPFNVVWNWVIILHFAFSGMTTYLFLRYLKASREASFAGGITFMLSGYLLSVHNLIPHLFAVSWFPLVILNFLKYFELKKVKHLVFTSLFLTMQFVAGAPEIVLMTVVVLCIMLIFLKSFIEESSSCFYRFKILFAVLLLCFLMSSVQLLPFYELKLQSIRSSGISYGEATLWSFAWKDFIQFFIPDPFGYTSTEEKYWQNQSWLKTIYLGVMPFFLSCFFYITKDKRRHFFLLLLIISLIIALGKHTPLYKLLYHIPPFSVIRYPVKFLFIFFFFISVTAALGLDSLQKGVNEGQGKTKNLIRFIFYFGFLFALSWGYIALFRSDVYNFFDSRGLKPDAYNDIGVNIHNIKRFFFFSFLFCVALLFYLRCRYKKLVLYVLVALVTSDLFLANYQHYQFKYWEQYIGKNEFREFVDILSHNKDTARYYSTPNTTKTFKTFPADRMAMDPHYASLFGLYAVDGAEVFRVAHQDTFLNILNASFSLEDVKRLLNISGVHYVITSYKTEDKDLKPLKHVEIGDRTAYLHAYLKYPGRFLLYSNVNFVKDEKTVIDALLDRNINLMQELFVISDETGTETYGDLKGTVNLKLYTPNKVILEADSPADSFLYISDTYYPGWTAFVDSKKTRIYRANLAFRAIKIPKGKHEVVFRYIPISFYIGLFLTIGGIALSIYLVRKKR